MSFELPRRFFRWSIVSAFMKLRFAQVASLIPIFGYAIIWNDKLSPLLSWRGDAPSGGIFFHADTRLYLMYFGSIFLTAALLIFHIACPRPIKKYADVEDFAAAQDSSLPKVDRHRQIKKNGKLVLPNPTNFTRKKSVQQVPESAYLPGAYETDVSPDPVKFNYSKNAGLILRREWSADVVGEYSILGRNSRMIYKIQYLQDEDSRIGMLFSCVLLSFVGAVMVLLPSLEVFLTASITVFR